MERRITNEYQLYFYMGVWAARIILEIKWRHSQKISELLPLILGVMDEVEETKLPLATNYSQMTVRI